jgi:hypothetical protein
VKSDPLFGLVIGAAALFAATILAAATQSGTRKRQPPKRSAPAVPQTLADGRPIAWQYIVEPNLDAPSRALKNAFRVYRPGDPAVDPSEDEDKAYSLLASGLC